MASVLHPEWLNQNAARAYPFQEDMQRLPYDAAGSTIAEAQLPNYVVVDLVFTLPSADNVRLYLSQLAVVGNLLTFVLAETDTGATVTTVTLDRSTHAANTGYTIAGSGDWEDARGRIVVGDLTRLDDDLAEGLYNFTPAQTLLEACTVRPAIRGVRTLQVQNLENLSALISGHVKLVAGDNITLTYDSTNNAIIISAVPNSGYKDTCACETGTAQTNVVRTINGIPIENVQLVSGDSCINVATSGNTITFTDKCSQPCCGCPELEFITDTLKVIDASLTRLEEYAQKLDDRITTFVTNFVITLG